ncbi:hypothetical protein HMF8227_01458 [Saliniradius amylolyticus]|uniref:Uncharacterized protein n=1 Tax=Saliniradius amylolyticus TaxID=2183582 RepID=A0A2S2E2S1_9ALTE|nr:hypothetical protein [Saliniradius amylolyticus]AWL11933.1 hypothetical protein HMF8227_01458 [Saliniradius amylolyticus]
MNGVSNPINMPKFLNDQSAYLLAELFAKILEEAGNTQGVVQTETGNLGAQLNDVLNQILTKIATENDQNEAILESITTVNGELDTNVQTINDHTTAENDTLRGEIFTELQRTTAGSLYKLLYDALNGRINTRATPADVTGARDSVKGAGNRDLTQVYNVVNALSGWATAADVNNARDNVKNEIVRTTAGSLYKLLYDALNSRIGTRATPTNVNAARDAVKAEIVRTTAGSLYDKVIDWVNTNVRAGWSLSGVRNAINTDIANARDNIKSHINAKQSPISSVQRGRFTGYITGGASHDIPISSIALSKSMLNASVAGKYSSDDNTSYITYRLLNSTTIRIYNDFGQNINVSLSWEVIEYV